MFRRKRRCDLSLVPAAPLLLLGCLMPVATRAGDFTFEVSPYLWVANIETESSVPSLGSGEERFESRISAGAMIAGQVQYKSVGLFVDVAWVRVDTEAVNPEPAFSDVALTSDFVHITAALAYSLPLKGDFHADLLAGARIWYVNKDFEASTGTLPGFKGSDNNSWVDPVIGAGLRYDLGRRWFLATRGFVGGFGVSSELTWEVFAGGGFRFTDWCALTLGYRYLREEYDRNPHQLQLDANGFLLGVQFRF